jgi:outer membrane protein assembly factor BamA
MRWVAVLAVFALVLAHAAHAQAPAPAATTAPVPAPAPAAPVPAPPRQADAASCLAIDTTPGAPLIPLPAGGVATPIPWTEFVVDGKLVGGDDRATVHALLEPTLLQYRTTLTAKTLRENVSKVTAKLGYQLVATQTKDIPGGVQLVLEVEPLPIVRHVSVDVDTPFFHLFDKLLDEEVKRRMQVRIGSYLPSDAMRRQCLLIEERVRIESFLQDEGYFEANVTITAPPEASGTTVVVRVSLGAEYHVCNPIIAKPPTGEPLPVSESAIKAKFSHKEVRILGFGFLTTRFTRTQHQEDLQQVKELFHKAEYPAARVQSSLNDPEALRASFDRRTKCVYPTIEIDPRRRVDIRFESTDRTVGDDWLRGQLTFDKAGSTDDVEAAASARAIAEALQKRGNFDAHVTWTRDRLPEFDRLTYFVKQGPGREVTGVGFTGNDDNIKEFNSDTLRGIVATKEATTKGDLLGTNTNATSPNLAADIDRIREYYRRAGYREAQVGVTASPVCPTGAGDCGVGDVGFAIALVEAAVGEDLYVRFDIDPGQRTLLADVEIEPGDANGEKELSAGLCQQLLAELASELKTPVFEKRLSGGKCRAGYDLAASGGALHGASGVPFREDEVGATKDRLRDFLIKQGRPRADLEYEARLLGPHLVEAHYKLRTAEPRKIGKIVIRGNFKTDPDIIRGELRLHEGDLLTSDALADAARRLRVTGLFDAVNIDPIDLGGESPFVNAIVRVEERYDYFAQVDLEVGYSSYNGLFGTVTTRLGNLWNVGANLSLTGTYGQKIKDLEGTFRLPQYLVEHYIGLPIQTELTGLYRQQDTPRFGLLTTEGAILAFSHVWQRPRTRTRARAQTISWSILHYDYRLRTRNLDALRPIGADMDDTQVAISTQTGSIGSTIDWDGRVDRAGQLSPLAAAEGFHIAGTLAYAFPEIAPLIGGQDTFVKASVTASKFYAFGDNLVLRGDFRYDEGFPLGGAVLLPDVERFFAGGDNTVRGYQDDRLATEIIRVGVPPLGGVEQIRVIPAGGNIRMLSSVDAQYRIYWIMAGAAFVDAGMINNRWGAVKVDDIRPATGVGLRFLSPFGIGAIEYAVPLHPHLGDDPRGRLHIYFAARAQF